MAGSIDIIRTVYEELFTVTFIHGGYGSPRPDFIGDNISLEPDEDTKFLFKNYDISYRFFTDTLICFMRCNDALPRVPFIPFSGPVRMRFFINTSAGFISKSVVEPAGALQVYQFTNQANIGTGGFISMHETGADNDDLKNASAVNAEKNCFGVIDVHNTGAVNSTYDLFSGANQTLLSPDYSIRFISRI